MEYTRWGIAPKNHAKGIFTAHLLYKTGEAGEASLCGQEAGDYLEVDTTQPCSSCHSCIKRVPGFARHRGRAAMLAALQGELSAVVPAYPLPELDGYSAPAKEAAMAKFNSMHRCDRQGMLLGLLARDLDVETAELEVYAQDPNGMPRDKVREHLALHQGWSAALVALGLMGDQIGKPIDACAFHSVITALARNASGMVSVWAPAITLWADSLDGVIDLFGLLRVVPGLIC